MVRKELFRTTETKMLTQHTGPTNLYHNTWNQHNWLADIAQGDSKGNRSGDEVFLQTIVTKLHFNSKPDRQASMIRALLVRVPADKANASASTLFEGGANGILNFVNTSECAVLASN